MQISTTGQLSPKHYAKSIGVGIEGASIFINAKEDFRLVHYVFESIEVLDKVIHALRECREVLVSHHGMSVEQGVHTKPTDNA